MNATKYMKSVNPYTSSIDCPLCGEKIKHVNHKKADLWACEKCPFVGFEFYGNDNLQDLINYLNK